MKDKNAVGAAACGVFFLDIMKKQHGGHPMKGVRHDGSASLRHSMKISGGRALFSASFDKV
ncbi:hypothetical protein [Alteribacillus persepolensis]|uniref:hypothetical protein n=1 Tax=Alteribacillus persepolensis TaxID=568899 RepID=UPI0011139F84|nr:hypothetical protein [Alteribacillus persepolensis]